MAQHPLGSSVGKPYFFSKRETTNWFYVPAIILFIVFTIYPLVSGFRMSFTDWDGYTSQKNAVGVANYIRLFSDEYFVRVLINTLIYGFGCTFLQQIFGLLLALILDTKIKIRDFARAVVYLPVLVSPIIMGIMYYLLLQYNDGALNDVMRLFGGQRIAWLSDSQAAVAIIVFVNTIQFMGISMIIYLAGLQGIPNEYYEATAIDGASKWQQFKHVTLPLLYPSLVTSITINLIGGLKLFDIIKVLTNGGPGYSTNSISTYLGITYFNAQSAGYASSMGVVLFALIMVVTIVFNAIFSKNEVYQ